MKREACPPVFLNNQKLLQTVDTKYLGMQLDRHGKNTSLRRGNNLD